MILDVNDERLATAPFVPVTIYLADGRFFTIDHPDFVALLRVDNALVIYAENERVAYLDAGNITSVETTEAGVAA